MRLQVIVINPHSSNYPKPIFFNAGERIELARYDHEYPGWVWATTADGNRGWAPVQYLDIPVGAVTATSTRHYNARELNTRLGDLLQVLDELNGWLRVRDTTGRTGWVPAATTRPTGDRSPGNVG